MSRFSVRLTHKIMAIGLIGLAGLLAFGAIYQIGSWSQEESRALAGGARAISDLNSQLSTQMLEARRAEKDFQLRRDESYSKRHAELTAGIGRDLQQLKSLARSGGFNEISDRIEVVEKGKPAFTLSRGAEGEDDWKVDAPVATRAARWSADTFLGLIEGLRMEKIVTETAQPKDLAKFGLGRPARRVAIGLGDGKTVTLEVGKKTEDGKYYARDSASSHVAVIPAAVRDDLDKGLKGLRAVRLLDVATYEVTSLDVTASGSTRTFTKSTIKGKDGIGQNVWKGTAPTKDAPDAAVSTAMIGIGGAEVVEFIDAPKGLPTYGLDAPAVRVTLRFDGGKKEDWFELSLKGDAAFARRRGDVSVLKLEKAKAEGMIQGFTGLGSAEAPAPTGN